jgi:hypothetical protein
VRQQRHIVRSLIGTEPDVVAVGEGARMQRPRVGLRGGTVVNPDVAERHADGGLDLRADFVSK